MHHGQNYVDLRYHQGSGLLYLVDSQDGAALIARGYSGKGVHRDKPLSEAAASAGPIPCGMWRIRPPIHHPRLGPLSFALEPVGHKAHNRTGFYIHGDNGKSDFSASSGCIILDRATRTVLGALGVRSLEVRP